MKKISSLFVMAMLSLPSLQAFAQDCGLLGCTTPNPIPEPGSLVLLAIGGVAAGAIRWSRRNKRK
jgi:hypothetical protein